MPVIISHPASFYLPYTGHIFYVFIQRGDLIQLYMLDIQTYVPDASTCYTVLCVLRSPSGCMRTPLHNRIYQFY